MNLRLNLRELRLSAAMVMRLQAPSTWTVVVMVLMVICAGGAEEVSEGMVSGNDERVFLPGDDGMELGESMSVQGPGTPPVHTVFSLVAHPRARCILFAREPSDTQRIPCRACCSCWPCTLCCDRRAEC